mmetsp:Transcript_33085/g.77421  ORF Transcript_33085/g.77421 Transcript_33085/m.77421 type:complete len:200 (+) Transcript_33085:62-661(+)
MPRNMSPVLQASLGVSDRNSGSRLRRCLVLLREVDTLPLEHVQERLGTLENLHVGCLSLHDCLVVLVARCNLTSERVVDARQPLGQDAEIILDLLFLLLILQDLPVDLLSLLLKILDTLDQLVVVVLQRRALRSHDSPSRCWKLALCSFLALPQDPPFFCFPSPPLMQCVSKPPATLCLPTFPSEQASTLSLWERTSRQ